MDQGSSAAARIGTRCEGPADCTELSRFWLPRGLPDQADRGAFRELGEAQQGGDVRLGQAAPPRGAHRAAGPA
jgi:hypothetical protein